MAHKEVQQLLAALDERGISLRRQDVACAFESSDTTESITQWVRQYVTPHTLLTREELNFSESKVEKGFGKGNNGVIIPDEDVETAIKALEASAASIERQCRILEAQKQAIGGIISRNGSPGKSKDHQKHHANKTMQEKAQVDFEQAESTASLRSRLESATKQAVTLKDNLPSGVDRAIERDNKILDGLDKVIAQLSTSNSASDDIQEVHQLCEALASHSSEDIRLQVDAAYYTAVQAQKDKMSHSHHGELPPDSTHQKSSIQAELKDLSQEIDGLSTMATDNLYRNPILHALRAAKGRADREAASWNEYLTAVLEYMIARMRAIHDHFHLTHSHKHALEMVASALEAVLASNLGSIQDSHQSPTKFSQKGLKPLRLVQANLSESQDPVVQLLRMLDIRAQDSGDTAKFAESLDAIARQQGSKLNTFSSRSEHGIADLLALCLAKVELDTQTLLKAVYAPSEFGEVKTLRSETQESMDGLENGTQSVGDGMRTLDLDKLSNILRDKEHLLLNQLQN